MINTYRANKIKFDVQQAEKKVAARQGQKDLLDSQLQEAIDKKTKAEAELGVFDLVQILLQKTSDYARQQVKTQIEMVVTQALDVVFGQGYKFWLELEVKSNRPEAQYFIEKDGVSVRMAPPDFSKGGGLVDVICLG